MKLKGQDDPKINYNEYLVDIKKLQYADFHLVNH